MTRAAQRRTTSHEQLEVAVQWIDRAASAAGHRQAVPVRRGPLSRILFAFDADGLLEQHHPDDEVTIQVLADQLDVTANGDVLHLRRGELVALAPKQPHAVRATAVSDMVLSMYRMPLEPKSA